MLFICVDNSDLNLEIDKTDLCSAQAMSDQGFAHLWAGVKATYGATRGRACYEVTITGNQPTDHLENEPNPHVLRCGWSLESSSLQLGTEPFSYGFGGTGKASVNNKFLNYGRPYGVGDVIGCYLVSLSDSNLILGLKVILILFRILIVTLPPSLILSTVSTSVLHLELPNQV